MRASVVLSAMLLPGCAFPERTAHLGPAADRGRFAGKRVRVTVGSPETDSARATTLRVARFDYPYLFGEIEREEVRTSGIWTEIPSRMEGTEERIDVRNVERLEVLQTDGPIVAETCLATGGFLFGVFVAVLAASWRGGASTYGGRRFWREERTLLPATFSVPGRGARRHAGANPRDAGLLASAWMDSARAEAASVPAFERMAEELRLAGAPHCLVRGAWRSAEEEVGHAQLAFREAEAWSGRAAGALPMERDARWTRPSPAALVRLAREAWFDGCLEEARSAEIAGRAAAATIDRDTARLHARIASEEAGHAELAWGVLEWAWREGGAEVRDAIVQAADEPCAAPAVTPETLADLDWLAAHGHPAPLLDTSHVDERARARLRAMTERL